MEGVEAIRISKLFLNKIMEQSQQTNESLVSLKDQGRKLNIIYLLCVGTIKVRSHLFVIQGQKSHVLSAIF